MKSLKASVLIAFVILYFSAITFSQEISFSGEWTGRLMIKEKGITTEKRIVIDGNRVVKYADERYDDSWFKSIDFETELHGNNIRIAWIKKSKYGFQAETLDIKFVNKDTLDVTWFRECTVYGDKWQPGDIAWKRHGSGYMVRASTNNTVAMAKE